MLPPFFIFKSNLCLGFLWSPHCRLISGLVSLFRTPLWLLFSLSLSVCGIRLLKYIINRGLVCHDNEDWMQHFTKQKRKGDVRLRGAGATDKRSKKIERVKKRNWRRSVCGGGELLVMTLQKPPGGKWEKPPFSLLPIQLWQAATEAYWGFQFAALYFRRAGWFTQAQFTEPAVQGGSQPLWHARECLWVY